MKPLLALALMLAGCSQKPDPRLSTDQSFHEVEVAVQKLDKTVDQHIGYVGKLIEIVEENDITIAALKKQVAWQRKRIAELEHPAPAYTAKAFESLKIDGTIYDISGTSSLHVASKERPIARFHYEGGVWCNVWADAEGIHWEVCR